MTVTEVRTDPLVQCQNLTLTYDGQTAARTVLKDISCAVMPGAQIALVGPSGSGKSSLIHVMAGLIAPDTGVITWPALRAHPTERPGKVVVAFQAPSLISALDVTENIELPLVLAGVSASDARVQATAMLESLGLGQLSTQLPEELSGGQAQRVALARALATKPSVLLADEPTGQVDHRTAAQLLDVVFEHAARSGMAVVIATHDQSVAARCTTRWEIHDGSLQNRGIGR
ncbi:putative ABC transport system ATP-binding protein [Antricoccus suffuscus]|uniref:Putative ABC transport system ATP-binding protein n=1 Tax=Antricoccus suffuscus TaxID=1629062 RepID=A0A2T1A5X2_9ACTN|nr:ATP-binding cassette domain-containing protein [Antricoccus suffuscus]PRZ43989.1 putative ABC transport system ATP-binding protein [Antricoccus suffuscus]